MVNNYCLWCGKEFVNPHFNRKYCDTKCTEKARYRRDREKRLLQDKKYKERRRLLQPEKYKERNTQNKFCLFCHCKIPYTNKYCSVSCREKARYKRDKIKRDEANKKYTIKNKEKVVEYRKNYYQKNKDKIKEKSRNYNIINSDILKIKRKDYYQDNKQDFVNRRENNWDKILEYERNKRKTDLNFCIKKRLRRGLAQAFKLSLNHGKTHSSSKYGIDYNAIIEYLKPFPEDISKYHIDHIRPLCSFDLTDPEQVKLAFAPENHRWLLKEENLKKLSQDRKMSIRRNKDNG